MNSAVLASGLTLSGGEASRQPRACARLARAAHEMGWDVWSWSGYTVEALMRQARRDAELADMRGQIDVLVDGPSSWSTAPSPCRGGGAVISE